MEAQEFSTEVVSAENWMVLLKFGIVMDMDVVNNVDFQIGW